MTDILFCLYVLFYLLPARQLFRSYSGDGRLMKHYSLMFENWRSRNTFPARTITENLLLHVLCCRCVGRSLFKSNNHLTVLLHLIDLLIMDSGLWKFHLKWKVSYSRQTKSKIQKKQESDKTLRHYQHVVARPCSVTIQAIMGHWCTNNAGHPTYPHI